MVFNSKQILLKFDFIGAIPEFRVLDETRYKSIFSSILSILLIIFSVVFVIYSFNEYLNQNPKVEYYKNNDYSTNKTFVISDSLLIFKYSLFCLTNLLAKPTVDIPSITGGERKDFTLESCKLGKNINPKHKELIEKFEKIKKWKLEDFYCINYNGSNVTLYSHPSLAFENETNLIFKISSECQNYILNLKLVTENDFIDHTKKDNPIVPYYQKNEYYVLRNDETNIDYNYQYIKYESDDGIIFSNKIISNGIGYGGSNPFDRIDYSSSIFTIDFKINSANYDFYRRSFIKFQSFLADVMSLINLLITISKIVSEFLLYKKMHKDIIRNILTMNEKENYIKRRNIISKNHKLDNIYDSDKVTKKEKYEKKIIENKILEDENSKNAIQLKNDVFVIENEIFDKKIINVMKNLNIINIMKSFFCYKERKLKLINLCNDIVYKDLCVERILKRLYTLENNYNLLLGEDKNIFYIDDDFWQINKLITKIDNEINKETKLKKKLTNKEKKEKGSK